MNWIYSHIEILVKVIQLSKDVYSKEAKNGKFKMEVGSKTRTVIKNQNGHSGNQINLILCLHNYKHPCYDQMGIYTKGFCTV